MSRLNATYLEGVYEKPIGLHWEEVVWNFK